MLAAIRDKLAFNLRTRIRSVPTGINRKSPIPHLVQEVCILPIGSGIWFPIRSITKNLRRMHREHSELVKRVDVAVANIKAEVDDLNRLIDEVGYSNVPVLIQQADGKFVEDTTSNAINYALKDFGGKLAVKPEKSVTKKQRFKPVVDPHRPRGNNQQQKK